MPVGKISLKLSKNLSAPPQILSIKMTSMTVVNQLFEDHKKMAAICMYKVLQTQWLSLLSL